jgi:DNA-binding ferritin-like protein
VRQSSPDRAQPDDPAAANHLAEIDARYDAHAAALRDHAALARAAADEGAAELAERLAPDPPEP